MNNIDELKSLSDDELLHRVVNLLAQSRRVEWVLVAHIAEVDARRLFAREASPSMIQYCMDVLHLSEGEAYRRIAAARLSRRYPVILSMLEDRRLHLCGLAVLSRHLTDANYEDVLTRATHKTKREIQKLVAELAPKPDVPPTIRKRPQRKANAAPPELCPGRVEAHARSAEPVSPAAPEKRATVEPLSKARYKVEFTASEELRDKLQRLQALMPGSELAAIIDAAVSEKLERVEAKRFGKTKHPRKSLEDADTSPGVRGISAAVRRFVWKRDGGQCTYETEDGRRCPAREKLEFHHDEPYALGGGRGPLNIRLMCSTHNAYMAELDFGKEKMDQYRSSADRVGEPLPAFEPGVDGAHSADGYSLHSNRYGGSSSSIAGNRPAPLMKQLSLLSSLVLETSPTKTLPWPGWPKN